MIFEAKPLKEAVEAVARNSSKSSGDPTSEMLRIYASEGKCLLFSYDPGSMVCREVPYVDGDTIDLCVHIRRMAAAVGSLDNINAIVVTVDKNLLTVQQEDAEFRFDTMSSSVFPSPPDFSKMEHVFSGLNPASHLDSFRHATTIKIGAIGGQDQVVFTPERSYLVGTSSMIVGTASLAQKPGTRPFAITLKALQALDCLGEDVHGWLSKTAYAAVDAHSDSWALMRLSGVDQRALETQNKTVHERLASLSVLGQAEVSRTELLEAAKAGLTILTQARSITRPSVRLIFHPDSLEVTGKLDKNVFKRSLTATCTGMYEIRVDPERLIAFLKASSDPDVYVRVMSSSVDERMAKSFLHLVDSELHEVISLPGQAIVDLEQPQSEVSV